MEGLPAAQHCVIDAKTKEKASMRGFFADDAILHSPAFGSRE